MPQYIHSPQSLTAMGLKAGLQDTKPDSDPVVRCKDVQRNENLNALPHCRITSATHTTFPGLQNHLHTLKLFTF